LAHLKLASAADVEPDAGLVELAETILARVKSGEIEGLFAVAECGPISREALIGGTLDADGIAGFAARCLASLANSA